MGDVFTSEHRTRDPRNYLTRPTLTHQFHYSRNHRVYSRSDFMFPDTDDEPSSSTQSLICNLVSGYVALHFGTPEICVPDGSRVVLWASVPKTSINEDRY